MFSLPLYTPMQCDAVPSTGPFLRWKNHFWILSVKYWLKPLCLFLLTTHWDTMGKETEAQRSNLAALCPIACFLLYDTATFWAFATLAPSWGTIFYQDHPLSFYRLTRVQALSLEPFEDWRKFFKNDVEDGGDVLLAFAFSSPSQGP